MDSTDKKIIEILQENGRITKQELATKIKLTPPATLERVRKLEKNNIIKGYKAIVNPESVGRDMVAVVLVELSLHRSDAIERFQRDVAEIPEILDCYHISGSWDFLLKVAVGTMQEYESFLLKKLTKVTGFSRSETAFVLSMLKHEEMLLPINDNIFIERPPRKRRLKSKSAV